MSLCQLATHPNFNALSPTVCLFSLRLDRMLSDFFKLLRLILCASKLLYLAQLAGIVQKGNVTNVTPNPYGRLLLLLILAQVLLYR